MANGEELNPGDLSVATNLRSIHYKISHFIGPSRTSRFFHSHVGHLWLMLIVISVFVLGAAYIASPLSGFELANNTSQEGTAGAGATVTATPTATPAETTSVPATGPSDNVTPEATSGIPGPEGTGTLSASAAAEATPESPSAETTVITTITTAVPETPATAAPGNWTLANVTALAVNGLRGAGSLVNANTLATIVFLFIIGFLIITGTRSRRQIVVDSFTNYTGGKADPATGTDTTFIGGVSMLLSGELHRLQRLYDDVDDRRPMASIGGRTSPLEYAITVGEDTGKKLEDLISSDATVKIFGFFDVPVGSIAGIFSKVFAGPRITGGFHRDGDLIILNAFLSGPDSRSWRVEGKIVAETPPPAREGVQNLLVPGADRSVRIVSDEKKEKLENLEAMVRELAYRIITDLTTGGTARWRATYAFSEGLRDYRSCLSSRKDQLRNLKNAERRFLEAISEDSTYGLAWYNLGVVYNELKNLDASDTAFMEAIGIEPDQWQSHYGLALNRFNRMLIGRQFIGCDKNRVPDEEQVFGVIHACNQAISLKPDNPDLYNLKGVCYRMLALRKRIPGTKTRESDALFRQAADSHEKAVKRAWKILCTSQYTAEDEAFFRNSDIQKVTAMALWDLARTYYAATVCGTGAGLEGGKDAPVIGEHMAPIESVLRQAIGIDPTNAALYRSLGNVCYARGMFPEAAAAFESATQIDPTNVRYWLLLAIASETAGDVQKRDFAIGKVLESPDALGDLQESWKTRVTVLPWEGRSRDLRMLFNFQYDCVKSAGFKVPKEHLKPEEILHLARTPPVSDFIPPFGDPGNEASGTHPSVKGSYLAYCLALHAEPHYAPSLYRHALAFIENEPKDSGWARWVRGTIYRELAKYAEKPLDDLKASREWFKTTPSFDTENQEIELCTVRALAQKYKETEYEALRHASIAVQTNPVGFYELVTYGTSLSKTGEVRQSVSAFESALLINPYDVDTLRSLGDSYQFLGANCEKREEKERYWKQAIRYLEDAREARKAEMLVEYRKDEESQPRADEKLLSISRKLGDLTFEMSEYGKAVLHYRVALNLTLYDSSYPDLQVPCYLKYAEALLHTRDHERCEKILYRRINEFEKLPAGQSPGPETEPPLSEHALLVPVQDTSNTSRITCNGEFYVRALLLLAYSYAERDAGLDGAEKWIRKADRVVTWMKEKVEEEIFEEGKEEDAGLTPRGNPGGLEWMKSFLTETIPDLRADILDHCGWVYFKKGDLQEAKKKILDALALKADADSYYHLATVYATMYWDSKDDKKDAIGRFAVAYCDHALNTVPRPGLAKKVTELKERISGQLTGQSVGKKDEPAAPSNAPGPLTKENTGYGTPDPKKG
jgi:tetratricopeptide (TPR) repeat protein